MGIKHRAEIDGLRALAVLPVLFFHADFTLFGRLLFPGGYVGVDVFFVISGYLITRIILNELQQGTFSFQKFWGRRVRRILPALGLVTAMTIPLGWIQMSDTQLANLGAGIMAVAASVTNILFWKQRNYFAESSQLNPLLHTWSLGVEEQFYLIFPLFLFITWKYYRVGIPFILGAVLLVSLALMEYFARKNSSASFYLLPFRTWELMAGSMIAYLEFTYGRQSKPLQSRLLPLLGILLILGSALLWEKNHYHSVTVPVIGACLILWFANGKDIGSCLLSFKWVVGIGLISYSLYLWHQPILAYARLFHIGTIPDAQKPWLLLLSCVLAYLSWRWVEMPFRNRTKINTKTLVFILTPFWLGLVAIGAVLYFYKGFPERVKIPQSVQDSFVYGDKLTPHKCGDVAGVYDKPDAWCRLGDKHKKKIVFLMYGDSHAYAAIPMFDAAAEELGIKGLTMSTGGCPPLLGIEPEKRPNTEDCIVLNRAMLEYAAQNNVKAVFLVARWSYYTYGRYDGSEIQAIRKVGGPLVKTRRALEETLRFGMQRTVEEYQKIGVQVHFIAQIPQQNYEPKEVYKALYLARPELRFAMLQRLAVRRQDHEAFMAFSNSAMREATEAAPGLAYFHDFTDLFCDQNICPLGTPDETYYWDDDHLSVTGALRLKDKIKAILQMK